MTRRLLRGRCSRALAAIFVAVIAMTAVACSSGPPALIAGPDRAGAVLSDDEIGAIAEALRLEDARTFEPAPFRRLTAHPSTEVRRRAVVAAGRIGDPRAADLLVEVLAGERSASVRADAAFALGELGDTTDAVIAALRGAVPRAWAPVRAEETTVAVEVVAALGKLGTDEGGRLIAEALRRTYPGAGRHSRRIAAEALLAAWKAPDPASRIPSITPFLHSPEAGLRWRAAYALMRMGEPETAPLLLDLLTGQADAPELDEPEGEMHRVLAYAARGLVAPFADSAGIRGPAVAALVEAFEHRHPHVRINALGALATYRDDAPLAPLVARLEDDDPNVAIAAVAALGRLGTRAAEALEVATREGRPGVGTAALAALAALDEDAAATIARQWTGGDLTSRYAAARAAPALGWDRAGDLLGRLAGDADDRVSIAALEAAAAFAADSALAARTRAGIRALLLEAAGIGTSRRSAAALTGLHPLLGPGDRAMLMDAYAEMTSVPPDPARRAAAIAAIRGLGGLRAADPDAASAFFGRFSPAEDRWIRRAVADTLGDGWGDPPAAVAADEASYFESIVRRYVAAPLAGEERPHAVIRTTTNGGAGNGDVVIELAADEAPLTVANFVRLAEDGYFDGGVWHRVVPNFVLQDGAPGGAGNGGPGWTIRDEINRLRYDRGVLGMALSGPDTGGSQWFITHSPQPHLDGGYTAFGRVLEGMDVADRVVQGDVIQSIRIRW